MLNSSRVLNYVKQHLGFPYQFIELDDKDILHHITEYTIREFSQYFPDVETIGYNPDHHANKVPGKANEYYLTDALNLEILNVVQIYWTLGDYIIHGHPPIGAFSMADLQQFAIDVETSGWVRQFSIFNRTFEFKHPNIIRVAGNPMQGYVAIEYERMQPKDFSKIPNDLQNWFLEMCLADIMILCGTIRKKYGDGNLKTPFGDIPLQSDIFERGTDRKKELIEKFTIGSLPNVIFSVG